MKRKMTAPEVAAQLRVSVEHVHGLVKAGALPAQRLRPRGRPLFDPGEVEAALRRGGRSETDRAAVAAAPRAQPVNGARETGGDPWPSE